MLQITPAKSKVEICDLTREQRGMGYGRQIFSGLAGISHEPGYTEMFLTVNKNNLSSVRVYECMGFSITRELVTDIGEGYVMDDYEMEISIPVQVP